MGESKGAGKSKQPIQVSYHVQFSDLWENPELVLTKMASSSWVKTAGTWIPEFFLKKFPYVQALTLVMLLAERAMKAEKYPPMPPNVIYAVAGFSILAGVLLTAKMKPKFAAYLYSLVLGYLAVNAYVNTKFNYSRHDRNRISSRHLGCMGVYLIYAFIKGNYQSKLTQRLGELCMSTYLIGTAYILNESYEDRRAFSELVPGGDYSRYFITLIFVACGLCFLAGYFLKDMSMAMVFVLVIFTLLVDVRYSYWRYRGVGYWAQMRLIMDHFTILAGFVLFSKHYENLAAEAESERMTEEEVEEEEEVKKAEGEEEYTGHWDPHEKHE